MAEEIRGGAPSSSSTVVHINRERSSLQGAPAADWTSGGVVAEQAAGTPWGALIGLFASVLWLGAGGTWVYRAVGLDGVMALPPVEAAALAAAAFLPVSIIWLVVAMVDRGTAMRREAAALRRQLALLAYPAEAAEGRIATIGESLRTQVRDLSAATHEAAGQGEALRTILSRETRDLARLTDQIDGDTRRTLGRVAEEVQGLSALMERVSALAGEMDQTLSRRIQALETTAGRAERGAETLGKSLDGQSRALNAAAEAVGRHCGEVEAMLSRQESTLVRGREVASAFDVAATTLSEAANNAISGLVRRTEDLETANKLLARRAAELAERLLFAQDVSQTLGETLDARARTLVEHGRDLGETARLATQELDAATASALGDLNSFRDAAHETLSGAHAATAAVREAQAGAEAIQTVLLGRSHDLQEAVRALGAEVQVAGAAICEQSAEIGQSSDKAGERIRHLADLLSRSAVDITRTTARSVVEIETVSEGLKAGVGQVEETASALRTTVETLGRESAAALDRLENMTAAMREGRAAVSEAAEAFAANTDRIAETANGALDALARAGFDLREEADGLAAAADGAIAHGRVLHETLAGVLDNYESAIAGSTERLDSLGERLRISAETYEATAVHASDRLSGASDDLEARTKAIQSVAAKATSAMDALSKNMEAKSGILDAAGRKVTENLHKAAGEFARHTEAVIGATRDAARQARELETVRDKVDLNRFLKDTSYAVERLQAAAVDITRLFSPALEDDLWRRFYKGEHNAFLRQAARSITRTQAAAVRKLFSQNGEFRDYASRYMGEYEALMKAARTNERADVLTAVFTASDMGRLYTILARSTGRANAI